MLSDDDFDQITNLLEQIDQFSDCLETDDAKENGLAKKMIVKMDEAKADTLNHEVQIEKVSNSSCLPPFIPNTLFSEADMDSFLESRKIQSNDAVAVKRIYTLYHHHRLKKKCWMDQRSQNYHSLILAFKTLDCPSK